MTTRSAPVGVKRWRRAGVVVASALGVLLAFAGFLHTPAGRPLLSKLAAKGCPFGHEKLAPARREALRRLGLSKLARTDRAATVHASLGFELGTTTRSDAEAWAKARHLECRTESQGAGLSCDDVPSVLVGQDGDERGSLTFRFDPRERLVGILRMVRTSDPARAATLASAARTKLRERLGKPTQASHEASAVMLASGPLRQSRADYRFRDFSAFASVTSLDRGSYLVTEEAQLAD